MKEQCILNSEVTIMTLNSSHIFLFQNVLQHLMNMACHSLNATQKSTYFQATVI